jgi:hypothetical protein
MDTLIRRTSRLFGYMLGVFAFALAISLVGIFGAGDSLDLQLFFLTMLSLSIVFFLFVFSFLFLVLIVAYGIDGFRQSRSSDKAIKKRVHHKRVSRFSRVDSMLSHLSDEERAYLERQLGAGELVVGDDGEFVTLEEYRKKKTGPR